MDIQVELAQKMADHRKTCQECTDRDVCDEGYEIQAKQLEAAMFGQLS